ncbi:hypothetical protein CMUST_01945 [Corynebacterium mustelae]|uniref:Uncharacterized protein n=1 Tax=Corynebacterium mustelae TaxID=571915 RepID=A0A0G3GUC0_9CORY|nr:hypothetical protein CMUST_01945 [Corynebacterium mustelae]
MTLITQLHIRKGFTTVMFGLPDFTFFVIVGVSLIWVLYTLVFWILSKNWHLADETEGQ